MPQITSDQFDPLPSGQVTPDQFDPLPSAAPPSAFGPGGAPLPSAAAPLSPTMTPPSGPVAAAQGYFGTLNAAQQRTSPVVRDVQGNLNYKRLGDSIDTDAGPGYVDSSGKWQLVSPTQHVMLTDPATGRMTVFERNQQMEESAPTALGRYASLGTLPGSPAIPLAGGSSVMSRILGWPVIKTVANWGTGALSGLLGEHFGLSPEVILGGLMGVGHTGVGGAATDWASRMLAARAAAGSGLPVMNPGTAAIPGLLTTATGGLQPQPPYGP